MFLIKLWERILEASINTCDTMSSDRINRHRNGHFSRETSIDGHKKIINYKLEDFDMVKTIGTGEGGFCTRSLRDKNRFFDTVLDGDKCPSIHGNIWLFLYLISQWKITVEKVFLWKVFDLEIGTHALTRRTCQTGRKVGISEGIICCLKFLGYIFWVWLLWKDQFGWPNNVEVFRDWYIY